ncbi:uncharacterized protein HaLaN_01995, partial [Haematococcus lacustris]
MHNMHSYTRFQPSDTDSMDEADHDPLLGQLPGGLPRVTGNWRRAWKSGSHDLESARVNHQFSSEDKVKLNNVESIDYLAPNSAIYRKC